MTLPSQTVEDPAAQRNFDSINAFGVPVLVLDHDPTDDDLPAPTIGTLALNSFTDALFVRSATAWIAL